MPTTIFVNSELKKQQHKHAAKLLESPEIGKIYHGSKPMEGTPAFCKYPGDLEGCRRLLIQAWREGCTDKHCIFEGLRANLHQCRQILLEGLKSNSLDLHEPCKQVILLGCPSEIKAIDEVFYEAYYQFVRSIIRGYGVKDNGQPSTDDVFQGAFGNLIEHFRKGASMEGRLQPYIASVTLHEYFKQLREMHKYTSFAEGQIQIRTSLSTVLLPTSVGEWWEDIDHQVARSDQGDLINRTIVAQQCLGSYSTGKRPSAKELMADWKLMSKMSEQDIAALHKKIVTQIKRSPDQSVAQVAADLINAGLLRPYQMAIVFAAGTGMDLEQTHKLIAQISNLSAAAVHTRICRIYMALAPPWKQEE